MFPTHLSKSALALYSISLHTPCSNSPVKLIQCLNALFYTARGIGESCSSSLQCEAELPYSTCDTDKRCRCLLGYVELNKSCSLGILSNYRNMFCIGLPLMFTCILNVNIQPSFIRMMLGIKIHSFNTFDNRIMNRMSMLKKFNQTFKMVLQTFKM